MNPTQKMTIWKKILILLVLILITLILAFVDLKSHHSQSSSTRQEIEIGENVPDPPDPDLQPNNEKTPPENLPEPEFQTLNSTEKRPELTRKEKKRQLALLPKAKHSQDGPDINFNNKQVSEDSNFNLPATILDKIYLGGVDDSWLQNYLQNIEKTREKIRNKQIKAIVPCDSTLETCEKPIVVDRLIARYAIKSRDAETEKWFTEHDVGAKWEMNRWKKLANWGRDPIFTKSEAKERPNCTTTILPKKYSSEENNDLQARSLARMYENNLFDFNVGFNNTTDESLPEPSIPKMIMGILTVPDNCDQRNNLRDSFLKYSLFDYRFLVDNANPAILAENATFGDIVELGAHWKGRANRFGEKLYLWYQYAYHNFPEYNIIGKMDDDVFICSEQLMSELQKAYDPYLYSKVHL